MEATAYVQHLSPLGRFDVAIVVYGYDAVTALPVDRTTAPAGALQQCNIGATRKKYGEVYALSTIAEQVRC
jgi:hypothetical protein